MSHSVSGLSSLSRFEVTTSKFPLPLRPRGLCRQGVRWADGLDTLPLRLFRFPAHLHISDFTHPPALGRIHRGKSPPAFTPQIHEDRAGTHWVGQSVGC